MAGNRKLPPFDPSSWPATLACATHAAGTRRLPHDRRHRRSRGFALLSFWRHSDDCSSRRADRACSLGFELVTVRSFSTLQALATSSNRRRRSSSQLKRFGIASRIQDRIDPSAQLDRLSRFLWHRERLATLRGQWMYFYTNLESGGNGLAGVNVNNGRTEREIRLSDLDDRFVTDEVLGVMFTASGERLFSHGLRR